MHIICNIGQHPPTPTPTPSPKTAARHQPRGRRPLVPPARVWRRAYHRHGLPGAPQRGVRHRGAKGHSEGTVCVGYLYVYLWMDMLQNAGGATTSQSIPNTIPPPFHTPHKTPLKKVAREVFEHLHALELNFHLNRSTGAVSRVIDRGAR